MKEFTIILSANGNTENPGRISTKPMPASIPAITTFIESRKTPTPIIAQNPQTRKINTNVVREFSKFWKFILMLIKPALVLESQFTINEPQTIFILFTAHDIFNLI